MEKFAGIEGFPLRPEDDAKTLAGMFLPAHVRERGEGGRGREGGRWEVGGGRWEVGDRESVWIYI